MILHSPLPCGHPPSPEGGFGNILKSQLSSESPSHEGDVANATGGA